MDSFREHSLYLGTRTCGECASFHECSKRDVKNTRSNTDYCQWLENRFMLSEAIRKETQPIYCEGVEPKTDTQPQGTPPVLGWFDSIKKELSGDSTGDWKIIP